MDKIFSKWYGLGSDCINLILPHYVQMDCKTDAVCDIHDTFCVRSMVNMELNMVKGTTVNESAYNLNRTAFVGGINHGTKVLKDLVET